MLIEKITYSISIRGRGTFQSESGRVRDILEELDVARDVRLNIED